MMGRCQALVACAGSPAVHRHHRKRRSQGINNYAENLLAVCLACHDWIHSHVAKAYDLGLLVHSWADPAFIPVITGAVA